MKLKPEYVHNPARTRGYNIQFIEEEEKNNNILLHTKLSP